MELSIQTFNKEYDDRMSVTDVETGVVFWIIKTNEGYIVDAYDTFEKHINTMTIWEDDYTELERGITINKTE